MTRMEQIKRARRQGASHLLVVSDSFAFETYPVQCYGEQDKKDKMEYYRGASMQRVLEVYPL